MMKALDSKHHAELKQTSFDGVGAEAAGRSVDQSLKMKTGHCGAAQAQGRDSTTHLSEKFGSPSGEQRAMVGANA